LKQVQERAGNVLEAVGIWQCFLKIAQMAQQLRERTDKGDYMKLKRFCTEKYMVSNLKNLPKEWEKNLCQLYI
jgi:valyl-tRNA synthetase